MKVAEKRVVRAARSTEAFHELVFEAAGNTLRLGVALADTKRVAVRSSRHSSRFLQEDDQALRQQSDESGLHRCRFGHFDPGSSLGWCRGCWRG